MINHFKPNNQHKWPCCWMIDFVFTLNTDVYANKPFALLKSRDKKIKISYLFKLSLA